MKQEQFSSSCIRGKKPCASSLSDVKTFTNSKKRQFTATNTIRLPQRKLPLGAIPSYMKNIKGYSNTVIAKKETHTKLKLKIISDSSFQDSMTKINKFNLKNESLSNILDQDETSASKIQLNSGDCVKIAVRNFLLELREVTNILIFFIGLTNIIF